MSDPVQHSWVLVLAGAEGGAGDSTASAMHGKRQHVAEAMVKKCCTLFERISSVQAVQCTIRLVKVNRFTRSYRGFLLGEWTFNRRATRARPLLVVEAPTVRFEAEAAKSDQVDARG